MLKIEFVVVYWCAADITVTVSLKNFVNHFLVRVHAIALLIYMKPLLHI